MCLLAVASPHRSIDHADGDGIVRPPCRPGRRRPRPRRPLPSSRLVDDGRTAIIGGGTRFPTPGPSSGAAAGGGGGSTPAPAPAPAASADCSLRTALWSLAISPSVTLAAAVNRRVTVGTTYDMVWSSSAPPTANDRLEVWAGGASVRSVALELNAARSIGECGKQSTVRLSFTDGDITAQTNAGQGYVSLRVAGGQVFGDADFKVEVVSPADTSCSGT